MGDKNYEKQHNRIDQGVFWTLIGLFVVPIYVRGMVIPTFYQINAFAVLGCLCVVYAVMHNGKLRKQDSIVYILISILTILLVFSEIHAGRTAKGFIRVFCGLIMPLPLLYRRMYNPEKTIRIVVNCFKFVSVVIVVMGLIDYAMNHRLMVAYYALAHDLNYSYMAMSSMRLYSYIGHPLYNAELFLMTFSLTFLYSEYFKHNHAKDIWMIVVTMLGVAMTASKSAIAMYLALLMIFYIKNIKYMFLSITILAIGYFNGIFDMVIERFSGSLTTGRAEVWERISSRGITFFHFLWGNGSDSKYSYAYLEEWARAAFEYPYRLYALEFGILFTIIIFIYLFFIPVIRMLKTKSNPGKMMFIITFLAITAHVNMYNGIGTYSDPLFLYTLFGCTLLNMNRLFERNSLVYEQ